MTDRPTQTEESGAPRLDSKILMEAASDDLAEAADLADLFFRLSDEQLSEMRQAAMRSDMETLRRVAHRAAGGAAACGLTRLADGLRGLEAAASEGAAGPEWMDSIQREYEAAREALTTFLGKAVRP